MKSSHPMSVLRTSREILERFLPGLDAELGALGFSKLEEPDGKAIALYRAASGAGLLIPETFKGKGATAMDAIHVQRALGARSPSMAVAVCMHNFSVATLVEMVRNGTGLEGLLLEAIATQNLLVASGFAEGKARAWNLVTDHDRCGHKRVHQNFRQQEAMQLKSINESPDGQCQDTCSSW